MRREFAIIRVKKQVVRTWEFPFSYDEVDESPLAGSLDELAVAKLDAVVGRFPFARRTGDGRRAWTINAPGRGEIDVWFTSDGSLFVDGQTTLNLVYGLYVHVLDAMPDLAVEDRITGVVHNRSSLLRLVRRDEAKLLPFDLPETPDRSPPLAA